MSENSETPSGLRKAFSLSPATVVHLKVGTIWAAVSALITGTIFVFGLWTNIQSGIKENKEKTDEILTTLKEIRQEMKTTKEKTDFLWFERMAARKP